jgi:hypothetical protein
MDVMQFDQIVHQLVNGGSRRGLLRLSASLPLAGALGVRLGLENAEAKKRKKKHKKKKKCGKNGGQPVNAKCCTKTVDVDGVCRACDVCASGCAFATLQAAIDAASPGATIAVCPGTYGGGLTIDKNLRLVGAGDGTGSTATVLQGAGDASVVSTTTGTIVLQKLRITGGGGDGAGVNIQGGSVELNGCTVSGNTSPGSFGGGIYNSGTLDLIESTVSGNSANGGGGIYNDGGTLRLSNSEISENTATGGGGIYNFFSSATVVFDAASRVSGNTASLNGGGIYNTGGTVTLVSSANVSGNTPNNCAGMPATALCSG